jgi:hypothetical protein
VNAENGMERRIREMKKLDLMFGYSEDRMRRTTKFHNFFSTFTT